MHKYMTVRTQDGSTWAVPVEMIARNRAKFYANEFGDDVERSLNEDTLPLFQRDKYEIQDWAVNNIDCRHCDEISSVRSGRTAGPSSRPHQHGSCQPAISLHVGFEIL